MLLVSQHVTGKGCGELLVPQAKEDPVQLESLQGFLLDICSNK